jgi:adenosylcobinamide-GDP ribazoletransferase
MVGRFLRHYLLAIQFFTRVPVRGALAEWVGYSPAMMRASTAHLPGVGWLVGGVVAAVLVFVLGALPPVPALPWVAAAFATAAGVLVTGGLHEDGLADTADGLGGAHTRERALEIMKDSRIGSYGVIALVLVLSTKVALLAMAVQVSPWMAVLGLLGAHVSSRFAPLLLIRHLPYVTHAQRAKSRSVAERLDPGALTVGLTWVALALGVLWWWSPGLHWLAALGGAAMGMGVVTRMLSRRLGGYTGDGLGAVQQLSELGFHLGLLVGLGPWGSGA